MPDEPLKGAAPDTVAVLPVEVHGPEHPEVAAAMSTLASVLEAQGRLADHPGHWLLATSESTLGACLTALGRHREAEPLLLGSYESLRRSRGEAHERKVEARQRVVALYEAWGKPAKAARYRSAPTPPTDR